MSLLDDYIAYVFQLGKMPKLIIDEKGDEKMSEKEMEERIEQLERQAKDEYLGDIEWSFVLEMLDDEEYAELKKLYIAMDDSMHTIMDDRGSDE